MSFDWFDVGDGLSLGDLRSTCLLNRSLKLLWFGEIPSDIGGVVKLVRLWFGDNLRLPSVVISDLLVESVRTDARSRRDLYTFTRLHLRRLLDQEMLFSGELTVATCSTFGGADGVLPDWGCRGALENMEKAGQCGGRILTPGRLHFFDFTTVLL